MYKRFLSGKKAVLFDLDGTLIDSQPYWMQAFTNILKPLGFEWINQYDYPPGITNTDKSALIIEKYKEQLAKKISIRDMVEHVEKEYVRLIMESSIEPREGFWHLIYYLKEEKKLKLGLSTNSTRKVTERIMEKIEVSKVFDLVITGDDVKKPKPHPEIYLKAAAQLGIKPEEALVFEDSIAGATAAIAARTGLIVIWTGYENKFKFPRGVLLFTPSFEGLHKTFEYSPEEILKMMAQETLSDKQKEDEDSI